MSVPRDPRLPELELLGSCQITSQLPPLLLDRGDEAGFTGQPQHVCVRTFLQEGEGGQHGSGGAGLHLPALPGSPCGGETQCSAPWTGQSNH